MIVQNVATLVFAWHIGSIWCMSDLLIVTIYVYTFIPP
jgi:hypothetical protein